MGFDSSCEFYDFMGCKSVMNTTVLWDVTSYRLVLYVVRVGMNMLPTSSE